MAQEATTAFDWVSIVVSGASLLVSLAALAVAWVAISRSDRNASSAMLVTLYESFRQGWVRFQAAQDADSSRYEMAELMNTFEIACAIHQGNAIHGHSREVLQEYLCDTISKFAQDAAAADLIRSMIDGPSTFKYLAMFQADMRRSGQINSTPLVTLGFSTR